MEEYNKRKLLNDVFGSSSSSSDTETEEILEFSSTDNKRGLVVHDSHSTTNPTTFSWEPIAKINGLWVCNNFLTSQQQPSLLSSLLTEGCFSEAAHNQAMRFGDLPFWALELSDQIHEAVCVGDKNANIGKLNLDSETYVLPPQLLSRDPFFDQLIVNVYQPGEGICSHVDLMQFEDGIAIVSLESSCIMHFTPADADGEVPLEKMIPVYLSPGSLVIMWGNARYHWKHEINRKPGFQVWRGQEIDQKSRTSVTLRKLCNSE